MAAQVFGAGNIQQREGDSSCWEYVRLQVDSQVIVKSDETLAALGAAGWELAAAVECRDSYLHLWLKREVPR